MTSTRVSLIGEPYDCVKPLYSGAIQPEVHIVAGLENLPQAQVNLFEHSTTGKVVVRVA